MSDANHTADQDLALARFKALVGAAADIFFRLNAQANVILEIAGSAEPKERLTPTEWLERRVEFNDRQRAHEALGRAVASGEREQLELRVRGARGHWTWVLCRLLPIKDAAGVVIEWLGTVRDISEYKQIQHSALAASKVDRFRAEFSDALRSFTDPADLQAAAGRMLAAHLGADRVCYADVSFTGEVGGDESWKHGETIPAAFGGGMDPTILSNCLKGLSTVVCDVLKDQTLSSVQRKKWADLGIQAQVTVPWRKEDRLLGLMTVYHLTPREWS